MPENGVRVQLYFCNRFTSNLTRVVTSFPNTREITHKIPGGYAAAHGSVTLLRETLVIKDERRYILWGLYESEIGNNFKIPSFYMGG
jgi:hypothetical protein